MLVWEEYGKRAAPHGKEWKEQFGHLLSSLLEKNVFPHEISAKLESEKYKMKASSFSDHRLTRLLAISDDNHHVTLIEDLPENTCFRFRNGRVYRKLEKMKKRYRCLCLNDRKQYIFSPSSPVEPLETDISRQNFPNFATHPNNKKE
jgi:hypothetical protein